MAGSADYYKYNSDDLDSLKDHLFGDQGGPVTLQKGADGNVIPPASLTAQVANAIARSVGSSGAALGDTSPAGEQPAPQTSAIRLYDDRTEAPKRSLKEMAAYGLIPLLTGLAGGLMNGNQGAYAGVGSGLNALKDKVDTEDKNYEKVKATKDINRSHIITAKLIRDLGSGKDGTGTPDKNRYMYLKGLNPKTGKGEYAKVDRNGQSMEWTGVPIYDYKGSGDWEPATEEEVTAASGGAAPKESGGFKTLTNQTVPPKGAATSLPKTTGQAEEAKTPEHFPTTGEEALENIRNSINEELGVIANKIPDMEKFTQSDYYKDQPLSRNEKERRMKNAEKELDRLRKRQDELQDKKLTASDKWYGQSIRPNDAQALKKEFEAFKDELERGDIRLHGDVAKDVNQAKGEVQKDVNEAKGEVQKGVNEAKPSKDGASVDPNTDPYDRKVQGLKSADKTHYDQAVMGLRAADDMDTALSKGSNTFSIVGDNPFTIARRNWEEAIGRLQSGGAINKDEEARFKRMAPTVTDSAAIQRKKINDMKGEMSARINSFGLDPQEALKRRRVIDERASGIGSGSATDSGFRPAIEANKAVVKAAADMVTMQAPDGSTRRVPRSSVESYKAKGAKVVGE